MSFGQQPSKSRADFLKRLLTGSRDGAIDDQEALKIWNSFRWQMNILPERTYQAIEALIDKTIVECQAKLKTPAVRDACVDKLTKMRARVSEFSVPLDEPEE